jgi:hypothetical protein
LSAANALAASSICRTSFTKSSARKTNMPLAMFCPEPEDLKKNLHLYISIMFRHKKVKAYRECLTVRSSVSGKKG